MMTNKEKLEATVRAAGMPVTSHTLIHASYSLAMSDFVGAGILPIGLAKLIAERAGALISEAGVSFLGDE
jgi:hypothetical protein